MNLTLFALSTLGLGLQAGQKAVEVEVNAKEGEVISTERTFTVRVRAKNPVNQVEFYVGDDLRETDSSTPYEFHLDSLAEEEGDLKLKFSAYTSEGESSSKIVTIKIDNGVSKGPDFHVDKAKESLSVSKWDDAIRSSRIALKAKPGHNPARVTMSRAYMGKGVLDQAQKYAEDALNADKNYLEAADLLSAINLKKAFSTYHRTGEQRDTLNVIGTAFKSAVQARRKILDAAFDGAGQPSGENVVKYADAAIRAGKYTAASNALQPVFRTDTRVQAVANRLAYSQLRNGRYDDALLTLNEHNRQGGLDAYGWSLMAILRTLKGDYSGADDAMRQAVLSDSEDLGVRTAQAFLAIARNRTQTLRQLSANLAKEEGQRSDVNYYLSVLASMTGDYTASRDAFERSVLAEPTNYDMYVQRGNESLALLASGRLDTAQNTYHVAAAKMFYETALEARPEAAEALTGMALVFMLDRKSPDALRFARGAVAAAPGYAAGHYVLSLVTSVLEADMRTAADRLLRAPKDGLLTPEQRAEYQKMLDDAARYGREAKLASDTAGRLDPANLQGRELPRLMPAYEYFAKYGRIPLIAAPK